MTSIFQRKLFSLYWLLCVLGKLADCAFSMYSIAEDLIVLKSIKSKNFLSWQCSQTEDGHVIIKPLMVNVAELDSVTVASHVSTLTYLYKLQCISGRDQLTSMVQPPALPTPHQRTRGQQGDRHQNQLSATGSLTRLLEPFISLRCPQLLELTSSDTSSSNAPT